MSVCNQVNNTQPPIRPEILTATKTSNCDTFYWCDFGFDINGTKFNQMSLIDTGANINIIDSKLLGTDLLQQYKVKPGKVNGVGGQTEVIGYCEATIKSGSIVFANMPFHILKDPNVPIIIGLKALKHPTVQRHLFDNEAKKLILSRTINGVVVEQSTSFMDFGGVFGTNLVCDKKPITFEDKLHFIRNDLGLDISHPVQDELKRVVDLLVAYRELFGEQTELFPYEVNIPTQGEPVSKNQHTVPLKHEPFVDAEFEKMLKDGVIESCDDPKGWRTPYLTVPKKDGSIRMCLNFKRTLNTRLAEEETFAQRPADELFANIRMGNKYFASLDLKKGYWQLPLAVGDRHKTCFQWKGQLYQFTRLPFGLKTAGSIFCRAISRALSSADFDLLSTFIYLDDICIMAKDFNTFVRALEKVFIGLKKFNLRLSPKKCKFLTKTIEFLGRQISEDKMEPTAANLEGIFAMEPPNSKAQLQSLIGSLGWLRGFIGTKMGKGSRPSPFLTIWLKLTSATVVNRSLGPGRLIWLSRKLSRN